VALIRKIFYFREIGFFFMILAVFGVGPKLQDGTGRLSMIILTLYIPFSAVFSALLDYRVLVLVPLFVIVASEFIDLKRLRWLAALTAALTLAYILNPMQTDTIHQRVPFPSVRPSR
jgi:hypothetical protein